MSAEFPESLEASEPAGGHPLLARQLGDAAIDRSSLPDDLRHRLDALLAEVGRTYASLEQGMLAVQLAERQAADELADLYRQLQHERDRLEYKVRERTADLLHSRGELAEAQRLAGMGSWQYLADIRRLEVSAELASLLDVPCLDRVAQPADLLRTIVEEDRPRALARLRLALRRPGAADAEVRVITRDGDIRWFACRIESEAGPEGSVVRVRGTFIDVTARRDAQARIERLAYHDELTGLPNRARFREYLQEAMLRAARTARAFAVLFIDLDGFKEINDSLGHDAGDALLVAIGERLRASLRDEDVLSRFGGDEFLILVEDIGGRADAAVIADKLLAGMNRPIVVGGIETRVSGSIGVAVHPGDGDDPRVLLKNADAAMYAAKSRGRGRFDFYAAEMNARSRDRLALVQELRTAIDASQFVLAYQPIVSGRSGRIEGVEALVRWSHPVRGIVAPGEFIGVAEETGLVGAIGRIVLRSACRQLAAWHANGHRDLYVSVNVSPAQFASGAFVEEVDRALAEFGLQPSSLQLEITESMMMRDPERSSRLIGRLKATGTRISIDDFGTGHSSLAYLRSFPVDVIKIDRTFVSDMGASGDDAPIVRAIIAIAGSLDAAVVAEGVETERQRDSLLGLGCERMQGYFFHRPMPAGVLATYLHGLPPRARGESPTHRAGAFAGVRQTQRLDS